MADKVEKEVKEVKDEVVVETPVEDKASTTDAAEPTEATEADGKPAPKVKKAKKRAVPEGQAHILATFNNTIITITDTKGNTLSSGSAGASGFRGSKKGTAYAAQIAAEKAIVAAKQGYGVSKLEVFIKGIGQGREAAVRTLINQKVEVENIKDITTTAHGGVRPRKARRT
jgi:small subunit ribosomal protein S11